MEYRNYKNTDVKTSLLGLGCMRLPRTGRGHEIDYEKAEEIIDYAYNNGINYYDSAYVYNGGESEKVMGKALSKYPRESYMLATKLPNIRMSSPEVIREAFAEQCERCCTDYIDFYLMHNLNEGSFETFMQPHVIETLLELKAEGKIKRLGFSSHAELETLRKFVEYGAGRFDFAQIQLNYLDWEYQDAKGQYELLTENGIPVVVMEPVRGGRLASITPEADKMLQDFAPGKSIASWGIRYAASLPNIQVVLSGMSNMEQIIDNVETISNFQPVSEEEIRLLTTAGNMLLGLTQVPCTACRYCVDDCPSSLQIPDLLAIYNSWNLSKSFFDLMPIIEGPEEERPDQCVACRECVGHCPQNIEIPDALEALAKALEQMPPRR